CHRRRNKPDLFDFHITLREVPNPKKNSIAKSRKRQRHHFVFQIARFWTAFAGLFFVILNIAWNLGFGSWDLLNIAWDLVLGLSGLLLSPASPRRPLSAPHPPDHPPR